MKSIYKRRIVPALPAVIILLIVMLMGVFVSGVAASFTFILGAVPLGASVAWWLNWNAEEVGREISQWSKRDGWK